MIDYCAERQYFKLRRGFFALVEQNPLRLPPQHLQVTSIFYVFIHPLTSVY